MNNRAVVEINPTLNYPKPRRLMIHAVRSSQGEGGPIDECQYEVLGAGCSPVWVKVSSLRPFITTGKIIS